MFNFFNKKKSVTSAELASLLWKCCLDMSEQFQKEIIPSIEESADLDLSVEEKKGAMLETPKLILWIISKILSSDTNVLNELHHFYASAMEKYFEKAGSPRSQQAIIDDLIETYKKYYDNWNNKSDGQQLVLSVEILQQLFNNGKPDRKFLNAFAAYPVNTYILITMKAVLDLRNDYEIV